MKELVAQYVEEAAERGILELRIVHGKGTGALKRLVHAVLERHELVVAFRLADETAGGWGATLVQLRPPRGEADMDLYLIRHAHAVDGDGMRDDDRPLSKDGRKQALDVGGALAKQKVSLARIVTSPLVRAVETAELVAVTLGFDGGLDVHDAMRPDGSWKHLVKRAPRRSTTTAAALALVGHEPTIGHFLSKLLHQKGLAMSKAQVVRLDWLDADTPATSSGRSRPSASIRRRRSDIVAG